MSDVTPKSSIIDIDEIFKEGREPTEEEWKVWAENFKPKKITSRGPEHEARLTKRKAKEALRDRERKKKEYRARKETGHKSWGSKYNQKRNYLYKYNKEYKARVVKERLIKNYKDSSKRYEYWVNKFRKEFKNRLGEHAYTYKISENEYVYGFNLIRLRQLGPLSRPVFNMFVEEHIFPPPKYEGYRFKKNKVSETKEEFYILTEAIVYFSIFDKNRKHIGQHTDEKKAYLKKKFWEEMLEARREFDE
jgi:hypothetical protein